MAFEGDPPEWLVKFVSQFRFASDAECWPWIGAKTRDGYGQFWIDGRPRRTHRVAYACWIGPIPGGTSVLHSCNNQACGNPAHLMLGTQTENMRDRYEPGWRLK